MFKRHHSKTQKTNKRYSFHRLRHDLKRTLWHAFDSLSNDSGNVHKSQLKVLASSIGRPLGVEKCEEYLDKHESVDLDYEEFYAILDQQLLEPLSRSPAETVQIGDNDFEEVHHVCWTLCSSKRISRRLPDLEKALSDDVLYKLWRIFNFLAESDDLHQPLFPLRMDKEEVKLIVQAFLSASGQMKLDNVIGSIEEHGVYSYTQFQALFEMEITKDLSDKILQDAIDTIYDEYINDTLIKGMIYKRGHQVKSWKVRWMVLTAGELSYYTAADQKDLKGCIKFDNDCRVEILSEEPGHKPNRFVVHTSSKPYEMSASDINTRNDWVSAVRSVIEHCDDDSFHFHQNEFIRRHEEREKQRKLEREKQRKEREKEERLKQEEAENIRRMQEEFDRRHQEHLLQLEREKKEREALEQRLRELEAMKAELERLLEEERQAKRDEEIVRSLQARLLEEETQKREELEKLKEQQEESLKLERQKREGLEGQNEQQENLLQQAQERLQELENQRKEADEMLRKHQEDAQRLQEQRLQLEREKKEREALEEKLREEAALRELDQQRLRELEAMKARILEEEMQKREELEKLKEQQEELLKMERQKREGLEGQKEQQECLLQQAQERLQQLENQRKEADEKLHEAHTKLQDAEKERIKLEDKVRLWKTPNIGLARPIQPKIDPHVTHRGKGAFCNEDFVKHPSDVREKECNSNKLQTLPQTDNAIVNKDSDHNLSASHGSDQKNKHEDTEPSKSENQQSTMNTEIEEDDKTQLSNSENTLVVNGVMNGHLDNKSETEIKNEIEGDLQKLSQNTSNELKENEKELLNEGPIYENMNVGQESVVPENCDDLDADVDADDTLNIRAFDNLIYENVELKIVESGD